MLPLDLSSFLTPVHSCHVEQELLPEILHFDAAGNKLTFVEVRRITILLYRPIVRDRTRLIYRALASKKLRLTSRKTSRTPKYTYDTGQVGSRKPANRRLSSHVPGVGGAGAIERCGWNRRGAHGEVSLGRGPSSPGFGCCVPVFLPPLSAPPSPHTTALPGSQKPKPTAT